MRLDRLEITGFGRLRATRVDFAPRVSVLIGDNEAGKSTVLRAVRAALYGLDAGGQGRAVERSEWARWSPWATTYYGLALTYTLEGGRRFRVARRLEQREQTAQVQELGGGDVTDQMRAGRQVLPGRHHLGIDEAVFCASACLGEGGLRLDAPDGAQQRVDRLQEAIERLADSASRATAAEAVARLRDAEARVGTERRVTSPLGAATAALRRLDLELEAARRRGQTVRLEQDRLHALEAAAAAADQRRLVSEREWLMGRIAAIAAQHRELASALDEAARLEAVVSGWRSFASFPYELEARVTALGGELTAAAAADAEAASRWETAYDRLGAIEERRAEIGASMRAIARVPLVADEDAEEAQRLAAAVAAESGSERRFQAVQAAEARAGALRQEIAATGLSAVPRHACDEVGRLLGQAGGASLARRVARGAAATMAVAVLAGAGAFGAGMRQAAPGVLRGAGAAAVVGGLVALGMLILGLRVGEKPADRARRELGRRCPGLDLSPSGILRARQRLPDLRALHADLERQEVLADAGHAELEESRRRIAEILGRCLTLAARIPVEVPSAGSRVDQSTVDGMLRRARAALEAVDDAAHVRRRRRELEEEDERLEREEEHCLELRGDAERKAEVRAALETELARHLDAASLPAQPDPAAAVAGFRQACSTRRQMETTQARLHEVKRRVHSLGSDLGALRRQRDQLAEELRRRGGDPERAERTTPLGPAQLQTLETAAEHARRSSIAATAEAVALRERLGGQLDSLPGVADLEDERSACLAARERALHQLEALRRARELIEEAAQRVHRNVAPRLAASVAERLATLTEGRYDDVNVDPGGFAVALRSQERPELVPLELLSQGTAQQVNLLLRIALTEVLGEAGEPVPLLLDEPLLSSDPGRSQRALDFLLRLSETTQVVLATSDPEVAEYVIAQRVDGCAVLRMEHPRLQAAVQEPLATGTAL